MTSNVVAKNSLMRGKFTRMVLWMPSFISFFEMPSIMNLASQRGVSSSSYCRQHDTGAIGKLNSLWTAFRKKLIKDDIRSTIRVIFLALVSFSNSIAVISS